MRNNRETHWFSQSRTSSPECFANTTHAKAATEHIDFHKIGDQVPSAWPIQSTQRLQPNTLIFTHSNMKSRVLGQYNASIDGYNKQFIIRKIKREKHETPTQERHDNKRRTLPPHPGAVAGARFIAKMSAARRREQPAVVQGQQQ